MTNMKVYKLALLLLIAVLTASLVGYSVLGNKVQRMRDQLQSMKSLAAKAEERNREVASLRELANKSRGKDEKISKLTLENERMTELLHTSIKEYDSLKSEVNRLDQRISELNQIAEQYRSTIAKARSLSKKHSTVRSDYQPSRKNIVYMQRQIDGLRHEVDELNDRMHESDTELIQETERVTEEREFVPRTEKRYIVVRSSGKRGAEYVGAKKCKACHIKQYKSWEKTSMAGSFDNLKAGAKADEKKKAGIDPEKDYTADPKCLKCHTTGYGKPGGFKSIEETPKLAGVQCESCHGPGSVYNPTMKAIQKAKKPYKTESLKAESLIIPSEDEKGCMSCHGGDSPFTEKVDAKYKWNFKERLEKTHRHFPLKYKQ
jgi:outer membrane murein-binding lipoprotein Lpp